MNSPTLTLILLLKYHKGKNKLKALSLARKLHAGSLEGKMEKYLKTHKKNGLNLWKQHVPLLSQPLIYLLLSKLATPASLPKYGKPIGCNIVLICSTIRKRVLLGISLQIFSEKAFVFLPRKCFHTFPSEQKIF